MSAFDTTKMSTKGQVVIPERIRKKFDLTEGTIFMVTGENGSVVLKKLDPPSREDLSELLEKARKQAKAAGLTQADVDAVIAEVRKERESRS